MTSPRGAVPPAPSPTFPGQTPHPTPAAGTWKDDQCQRPWPEHNFMRLRAVRFLPLILVAGVGLLRTPADEPPTGGGKKPAKSNQVRFSGQVVPLLEKYCIK